MGSVADDVERMVFAFDRGDDRQAAVRALAAKVRELETPYCDVCGEEGAALRTPVEVCKDCYDSAKDVDLQQMVRLVPIRADLLDLMATCGVETAGNMAFAEDLLAVKRYVVGLQETVTHLMSCRVLTTPESIG